MEQTLPPNNQNEDKNSVSAPPSSPVFPKTEAAFKPQQDTDFKNVSQPFKLSSAEVQGPKPPLVKSSGSKFALIAIISVLIIVAGIGWYYFYGKDTITPPSANSPSVSPAAAPVVDKNLDSDSDGLPDAIEKVLGAYMTKADTDGDGFNDLEEIKNGYNPLVAGGSGKYTQEQWDNVKGKIKIEDREFYEKTFEAPAVLSPSSSPLVTPTATLTPLSFNCGTDTVSDVDNNIYNTVKIGEQCWLKENLKVTKNPKGEAITRYCYDNDVNICNTDGGLYDWNTAMDNSTTEGAQGICMAGWHVPKDSEWYVLENGLKDDGQTCDANRSGYAWDCSSAGTKLKLNGSSGFKAIFAGNRGVDGQYFLRGVDMYFWTSSESNTNVWVRMLGSGGSTIRRDSTEDITLGFSVRCLKD